MATHKINMIQPSKVVFNSDVQFEIFSDGQKLGTMKISKGSIDWTPKNRTKAKPISWERFAATMDTLAS